MNPSHLVPCPSCTRHVRVREQACPFCSVGLPPSFAATPAPRRTAAVRLGRAALYAVGGTLTVACGSSTVAIYGAPAVDASMDAADSGQSAALYGAAPAYGASALPVDSGMD